MNRRDLERRLIEAGAIVEQVSRTGENIYRFPGLHPVRVNARRKDATRAGIVFLKRVEDLKREG